MHERIEKLQEAIESLQETIEILKDEELMAAFHQGVQDVAMGQVKPWEEVKKELDLE